MSLYVLVGPDGKVYERTTAINENYVWDNAGLPRALCPDVPKVGRSADVDEPKARRLGWRVRKCHIVLDEE